jgi:hypothetical protein
MFNSYAEEMRGENAWFKFIDIVKDYIATHPAIGDLEVIECTGEISCINYFESN